MTREELAFHAAGFAVCVWAVAETVRTQRRMRELADMQISWVKSELMSEEDFPNG